jgi:hypothetical protein
MNEDQSLPRTIERRYSLKAATIRVLGVMAEAVSKTRPCQVLLLTSLGIISGTISPMATTKDQFTTNIEGTVDQSYVYQLRNDHLKKFEEEQAKVEIVDNDSAINLVDATLVSGQNTHTFKQLLIFSDQIIGFSLLDEEQPVSE